MESQYILLLESAKCCIGDGTGGAMAEILDTKSFYEIVKGHIY